MTPMNLSPNATEYVAKFATDDPRISTIAIGLLNAKAKNGYKVFSAWLTSHLDFLQREESATVVLDTVKNRDLLKGVNRSLLVSKAASMPPSVFVSWLKRHQAWRRYEERVAMTKEFTPDEGKRTVWDAVRSMQDLAAKQQSEAASQQRLADKADGWSTVSGRGAATFPKPAAVHPPASSGFCVLREEFPSRSNPTPAEAFACAL